MRRKFVQGIMFRQWKLVAQLCPILWNLMDSSPQSSTVYGTSQVRILELVAIPFSRGSSIPFDRESYWPRDWTQVSCIAAGFFTIWATMEAPCLETCLIVYEKL